MNDRVLGELTKFTEKHLEEMLEGKGESIMCEETKETVELGEASKKILRWASWMGEVVCFFIDHGHEEDVEAMFHVMDAATSEIQVLIGKHETDVSEAFHSLRALFNEPVNMTDADKEFVKEKVLEVIERVKGESNG